MRVKDWDEAVRYGESPLAAADEAWAKKADGTGEHWRSEGHEAKWTDIPSNALGAVGVSLEDFHAHVPTHAYIYVPSREMWPAGSVNSRIDPIPVYDIEGDPVLDRNGNQK